MPSTPDCEAVALWRLRFRLNLSQSWKKDVEITITDIELWKSILAGWYYFDAKGKKHKKAPGIKNLLTEYERLELKAKEERERQMEATEIKRSNVSNGGNQSIPEWLHRAVPNLLD